MPNVTITARRWSGGWELWNEGDCWTQVASLDKARQQVIDYLDTIQEDVDHSAWDIEIAPDIGALGEEVAAARAATEQAAEATAAAAKRSRDVARRLRHAGFSVSDSAVILGVSRGRVSQLVK
uniref:antitoxin HicB n=1 Tax=Tessaracoccus timonensis TaxID=2161816 RepID=UPI000D560BF0|nr:antitoxin HicB [Tessaracoccus timonensis]